MDETFHALEALISRERQDKIKRYRFDNDKMRGLYAEILLRYTLKKHFGIEGALVEFEQNEYGKPALKGNQDIKFNLSHSGNWVICAVSDKDVGVDVEEIKEKELDIAKRFFAPCEYQYIKNSHNPSEKFFTYWTLKESYVKAEGKGMSIPFDSFSFSLEPEEDGDSEYKIALEVNERTCDAYQFQTYQLDSEVMISTCSKEQIEGKFQIVSLTELRITLL